jgi:hypothetical protein
MLGQDFGLTGTLKFLKALLHDPVFGTVKGQRDYPSARRH